MTSRGPICQSLASSTTKHPIKNHFLTYDDDDDDKDDDNNIINYINNNDNNNPTVNSRSRRAKHNHQDDRRATVDSATKRKQPGLFGNHIPNSSANNSKSMSKTLSDNKTSFSVLTVRVLNISVNLQLTGDKCAIGDGVPSLVRIPKSDRPSSGHFSLDSLDNYSLLGSCLHSGKYNNNKSNSSLLSNNNDNYKSVILLSSTSNHYFLLVEMDGGAIYAMRLRPCSGLFRFLVNSSFDGLSLQKQCFYQSRNKHSVIMEISLTNDQIIQTRYSSIEFICEALKILMEFLLNYSMFTNDCYRIKIHLEFKELSMGYCVTRLISIEDIVGKKLLYGYQGAKMSPIEIYLKPLQISRYLSYNLVFENIYLIVSNLQAKFRLFYLEFINLLKSTKQKMRGVEIEKILLCEIHRKSVLSIFSVINGSSIIMGIKEKIEEALKTLKTFILDDLLFINNIATNYREAIIDGICRRISSTSPLNFVTPKKVRASDRSIVG